MARNFMLQFMKLKTGKASHCLDEWQTLCKKLIIGANVEEKKCCTNLFHVLKCRHLCKMWQRNISLSFFFFFFCKTRGKRNCIARSNFYTTSHKQRQVKHLSALTNIESNVKCETDYGRIKFGGKNVLIFLYVIKRRYPFKMY